MGNEQAAATSAPPETDRSQLDPIDRRSLNLPNAVTLTRLLLAFVLFFLIWYQGLWITAAVLFVFAASTDFVDGWLARRYGQVTTLGRIMDPFVDKIIVCGAFIFLLEKKVDVIHIGEKWSGVNAWMVIIIVGREMFVSSLRGVLEKQGLDFSASFSGKLKMAVQCIAVTASLVSLSPEVVTRWPWFGALRDVLLWTAVVVTVWSGGVYITRAAQLLKERAKD